MRRRGLTLAEVIFGLTLFALVSTVLLATVSLSLRYGGLLSHRLTSSSNARMVLGTLAAEMRGGLPCPSAAVGYLGLAPAVEPTAVLLPNANSPAASEVVFTEPDPATYAPLLPGFDRIVPANYRRVRYFTRDGAAWRQQVRFTSLGTPLETREELLVRAGTVEIAATYRAADLFDVRVTASEVGETSSLATRIFVVGR